MTPAPAAPVASGRITLSHFKMWPALYLAAFSGSLILCFLRKVLKPISRQGCESAFLGARTGIPGRATISGPTGPCGTHPSWCSSHHRYCLMAHPNPSSWEPTGLCSPVKTPSRSSEIPGISVAFWLPRCSRTLLGLDAPPMLLPTCQDSLQLDIDAVLFCQTTWAYLGATPEGPFRPGNPGLNGNQPCMKPGYSRTSLRTWFTLHTHPVMIQHQGSGA